MTNFWDYFSHGSEYERDFKALNVSRSKCCNSCAFTDSKNTVRPYDISLENMINKGDEFDVFYCHESDSDGKLKICATWYKLFGNICLPKLAESENYIDEILNKDFAND